MRFKRKKGGEEKSVKWRKGEGCEVRERGRVRGGRGGGKCDMEESVKWRTGGDVGN